MDVRTVLIIAGVLGAGYVVSQGVGRGGNNAGDNPLAALGLGGGSGGPGLAGGLVQALQGQIGMLGSGLSALAQGTGEQVAALTGGLVDLGGQVSTGFEHLSSEFTASLMGMGSGITELGGQIQGLEGLVAALSGRVATIEQSPFGWVFDEDVGIQPQPVPVQVGGGSVSQPVLFVAFEGNTTPSPVYIGAGGTYFGGLPDEDIPWNPNNPEGFSSSNGGVATNSPSSTSSTSSGGGVAAGTGAPGGGGPSGSIGVSAPSTVSVSAPTSAYSSSLASAPSGWASED